MPAPPPSRISPAPQTGERAVRATVRAITWLAVAAALAYPADWAVWRIRVARGGGIGNVDYSHVTAAELKNGKEDYYWDGTVNMQCSQSIFPEGGMSACWYLSSHAEQVARP